MKCLRLRNSSSFSGSVDFLWKIIEFFFVSRKGQLFDTFLHSKCSLDTNPSATSHILFIFPLFNFQNKFVEWYWYFAYYQHVGNIASQKNNSNVTTQFGIVTLFYWFPRQPYYLLQVYFLPKGIIPTLKQNCKRKQGRCNLGSTVFFSLDFWKFPRIDKARSPENEVEGGWFMY